MKKKLYIPKEKEFYLLNDRAEVFAGLKKGLPFFSSNWDDGKPLVNDKQVISDIQKSLNKQDGLYQIDGDKLYKRNSYNNN